MVKILVVDDERLTADTLGLIFSKHGFETRVVYTVDEALDHAREFEPALILCDITMPGRDGLELMIELARRHFTGAILVLTGYFANLNPVCEQFMKMSQRTHVLTKPCRPEDLLRQADKLLAVAS